MKFKRPVIIITVLAVVVAGILIFKQLRDSANAGLTAKKLDITELKELPNNAENQFIRQRLFSRGQDLYYLPRQSVLKRVSLESGQYSLLSDSSSGAISIADPPDYFSETRGVNTFIYRGSEKNAAKQLPAKSLVWISGDEYLYLRSTDGAIVRGDVNAATESILNNFGGAQLFKIGDNVAIRVRPAYTDDVPQIKLPSELIIYSPAEGRVISRVSNVDKIQSSDNAVFFNQVGSNTINLVTDSGQTIELPFRLLDEDILATKLGSTVITIKASDDYRLSIDKYDIVTKQQQGMVISTNLGRVKEIAATPYGLIVLSTGGVWLFPDAI